MRLFVAVELPTGARDDIAERIAAVRDDLPPASWVRRETLHLTLLFLGEVEEASVGRLSEALRRAVVDVPRFAARLGGAGAFPPRGTVRVVWLGLEPHAMLERLAAAVRAGAQAAGAPFDSRPFSSHVTLARCRRPWSATQRKRLNELESTAGVEFGIAAAALMSSELAPGGARHTRLVELPLGAAA